MLLKILFTFYRGEIVKIIININRCYACKICQLICSFHHTKAFWPDRSSIIVSRNTQNGFIKWCIDSTCDGCKGEDTPLCVKFCVYGALQILNENINEQGVKDNA